MVVGTFIILNLFLAILLSNFQGLELRTTVEVENLELGSGSTSSKFSTITEDKRAWCRCLWLVRLNQVRIPRDVAASPFHRHAERLPVPESRSSLIHLSRPLHHRHCFAVPVPTSDSAFVDTRVHL
jgi:hypothetical protein